MHATAILRSVVAQPPSSSCAPSARPTGSPRPGKKHIGRPAVTGPAELAALRGLIADGKSVTEAARILKIGRSTAYAALAAT